MRKIVPITKNKFVAHKIFCFFHFLKLLYRYRDWHGRQKWKQIDRDMLKYKQDLWAEVL